MPDRCEPIDSGTGGRNEIEGQGDAVGQPSGCRRIEHPDARLERQQRPFAFGVGPRSEGALPEKIAAREAEHRFDAHVGVGNRRACAVEHLSGEPIERLRRKVRRQHHRDAHE